MGVPVLTAVPCTCWGFEPGKGTPPSLTTGAVVVDPGFGTADPGLGTFDVGFGTAPASPTLDPGRGVPMLGFGTPCPCEADIFRGIGAWTGAWGCEMGVDAPVVEGGSVPAAG